MENVKVRQGSKNTIDFIERNGKYESELTAEEKKEIKARDKEMEKLQNEEQGGFSI